MMVPIISSILAVNMLIVIQYPRALPDPYQIHASILGSQQLHEDNLLPG